MNGFSPRPQARSARLALPTASDPRDAHLPPAERQTVVRTWGTGPTADRGSVTVAELIQQQAARTPGAPAVRTSGVVLTYRELEERSNQIAHHLVDLGAQPDALVGVCLRRVAELLPALLGVWKSGAGFVPLDPGLPAERLRHMIRAAGCTLVATVTEHLPNLGPLDGRFVLLDEERRAIDALPVTPAGVASDPAQLAYVIYTSGSTGVPKGVMVEHRGLANYLLWAAETYAAAGTGGSPVCTSISFDLGMPSLFAPLLAGQAVHLLPEPLAVADLGDLLVAGGPYSFIKLTPGHLNLLNFDLTPEQIRHLAGLIIAAGDSFATTVAAQWIESAGPDGTAVATEYGPTEITIGNSGQVIPELPAADLIPLGAPLPNTTMYVLNNRLDLVPIGVPGEIYVGGVGVARGYLRQPGLTADRFVPDPYGLPGSRLYRTGDRARWWPDGSLEFLGRTDHQVKINGFRVELGEIRARLGRHPDVGQAVVIAYGPSYRARLAAFVVPVPGRTTDAGRLRAHLAADLPAHMMPAEIVAIDHVPLTANGKTDTAALRELLTSCGRGQEGEEG